MNVSRLNPVNGFRVTREDAAVHALTRYYEMPILGPLRARELYTLYGGGALAFGVAILLGRLSSSAEVGIVCYFLLALPVLACLPGRAEIARRRTGILGARDVLRDIAGERGQNSKDLE